MSVWCYMQMYEYYQGGSVTQLIFSECFKETIADQKDYRVKELYHLKCVCANVHRERPTIRKPKRENDRENNQGSSVLPQIFQLISKSVDFEVDSLMFFKH